jgi:hypothetical protein
MGLGLLPTTRDKLSANPIVILEMLQVNRLIKKVWD